MTRAQRIALLTTVDTSKARRAKRRKMNLRKRSYR